MRFQSGVTDQYIYFVAVDSTDYVTRETGLSAFTVYRSRDGAAAAAFTTPTINETDSTNMPGVYELLLDEDMTIGSGNDSEAVVLHITCTGMAPVTIMYELYRPLITAGSTITVANSCVDADIERLQGSAIATPTVAGVLEVDVTHFGGSAGTFASGRPETNTSHIAGSAVSTSTAQIGVNVVNFGGSAGTFASGRPEVNTSHWRGTAAAAPTTAGVPAVEVIDMSSAGQTDVRAAVGLATANLDTQLDALPTAAENTTAVWAAATRTLTALDEDSTTLDLDATIRAAVGLAAANLDTQIGTLATAANLATVAGYLDTEIAAILADTNELQTDWVDGGRLDLIVDAINAKTTNLPSDPADASVIAGRFDTLDTSIAALPTAAENATELFDQAAGVETGLTLRQWCRLVGASTAGKLSGAGTGTETIRNAVADSKDRLIATVDGDGNRTAITYDLT